MRKNARMLRSFEKNGCPMPIHCPTLHLSDFGLNSGKHLLQYIKTTNLCIKKRKHFFKKRLTLLLHEKVNTSHVMLDSLELTHYKID